jgi:uncharacterized protein
MATKIFVNLPVQDLNKSMAFFEALGYSFNRQFTDATAACLVISEDIYAMLMTHEKFKGFTSREVCDASRSNEAMICLSCENRAQVDDLVRKAVAAGGTAPAPPTDYGFMYNHGFEDLDRHIWALVSMDPSHIQKT